MVPVGLCPPICSPEFGDAWVERAQPGLVNRDLPVLVLALGSEGDPMMALYRRSEMEGKPRKTYLERCKDFRAVLCLSHLVSAHEINMQHLIMHIFKPRPFFWERGSTSR